MNDKAKGWIAFVVVIAVIVIGYLALSGPAEDVTEDVAVEESGPIVIGVITPLSGDAAVYGEPSLNVLNLAASQINDAGGVNGRMIELVPQDGACNGTDAANAMQQLVNVEGVEIVIGGFCSSESLAAAPIANENEVLLFSVGSSSPDLTTEGGDYFFRNYPSDASQGTVLADVAYNHYEYTSVAVIQENLDYPLGIYNAFDSAFSELGGETTVETFAPETEDFRTTLAKLQELDADALLVSVQTPSSAERILQQVQELDWDVALIGADVIPGSDLASESPELVEGMLVAEFGCDEESAEFQEFFNAYIEMYDADPEFLSYAQTEYDGLFILADAIAEVGEDASEIRQWLLDLEGWSGVSGIIEFDENGDRSEGGHSPEVILDGVVTALEI